MSGHKSQFTSLKDQQSGLVSIVIAIGFITIISLIATGFALVSRREGRQALDRQLSTQAFYAAESGVNDAIQKIKAGAANITDCDQVNTINPAQASLGNELAYTCVLINESPTNLEFDQSAGVSIKRVQAASPITKLRISWQSKNNDKTFAPAGSQAVLPQKDYVANNSNKFPSTAPILRLTATPVPGGFTRQDLINNTQTLFLYPYEVNSPANPVQQPFQSGLDTQGSIVSGNCHEDNDSLNLPRYCNVEITGLNSTLIYLSLKSLYTDSNVAIEAFGADGQLTLLNGQAVIDATGRANDVLRRIQVRVPIEETSDVPGFALQVTDGICKKISVAPSVVIDGCTSYYNND